MSLSSSDESTQMGRGRFPRDRRRQQTDAAQPRQLQPRKDSYARSMTFQHTSRHKERQRSERLGRGRLQPTQLVQNSSAVAAQPRMQAEYHECATTSYHLLDQMRTPAKRRRWLTILMMTDMLMLVLVNAHLPSQQGCSRRNSKEGQACARMRAEVRPGNRIRSTRSRGLLRLPRRPCPRTAKTPLSRKIAATAVSVMLVDMARTRVTLAVAVPKPFRDVAVLHLIQLPREQCDETTAMRAVMPPALLRQTLLYVREVLTRGHVKRLILARRVRLKCPIPR